ncbi:MAG: hypothetical protein HY725_11750 [Candidatus Rokubacteria bacterium]|nr:hypothetical protein [Candidatus Rokubacteria bacterium]
MEVVGDIIEHDPCLARAGRVHAENVQDSARKPLEELGVPPHRVQAGDLDEAVTHGSPRRCVPTWFTRRLPGEPEHGSQQASPVRGPVPSRGRVCTALVIPGRRRISASVVATRSASSGSVRTRSAAAVYKYGAVGQVAGFGAAPVSALVSQEAR